MARALAEILDAPLAGSLDLAVIATDAAGQVVYWNPAASRLYGWSAKAALGRNIMELTPAVQSREKAAEIMDELQQGRSWHGEIVLRRRGGSPFRAYVLDVPLGDLENGSGVIVGLSLPAQQAAKIIRLSAAIQAELNGRLA